MPFKFQSGNLTWLGTELSPSEPQNGMAILYSTCPSLDYAKCSDHIAIQINYLLQNTKVMHNNHLFTVLQHSSKQKGKAQYIPVSSFKTKGTIFSLIFCEKIYNLNLM